MRIVFAIVTFFIFSWTAHFQQIDERVRVRNSEIISNPNVNEIFVTLQNRWSVQFLFLDKLDGGRYWNSEVCFHFEQDVPICENMVLPGPVYVGGHYSQGRDTFQIMMSDGVCRYLIGLNGVDITLGELHCPVDVVYN